MLPWRQGRWRLEFGHDRVTSVVCVWPQWRHDVHDVGVTLRDVNDVDRASVTSRSVTSRVWTWPRDVSRVFDVNDDMTCMTSVSLCVTSWRRTTWPYDALPYILRISTAAINSTTCVRSRIISVTLTSPSSCVSKVCQTKLLLRVYVTIHDNDNNDVDDRGSGASQTPQTVCPIHSSRRPLWIILQVPNVGNVCSCCTILLNQSINQYSFNKMVYRMQRQTIEVPVYTEQNGCYDMW